MILPQFISEEEQNLNQEFLEDGFIVFQAANVELLEQIRKTVVGSAMNFLGISRTDASSVLNQIHQQVDVGGLNEFRLHVIQQMNSNLWFRAAHCLLAKTILEAVVGNELAMQLRINLSIQLPHDDSSLLPVHADVWSGDSPFEVVDWLPLVDCYGSKAMYLLPPEATKKLHENFHEL